MNFVPKLNGSDIARVIISSGYDMVLFGSEMTYEKFQNINISLGYLLEEAYIVTINPPEVNKYGQSYILVSDWRTMKCHLFGFVVTVFIICTSINIGSTDIISRTRTLLEPKKWKFLKMCSDYWHLFWKLMPSLFLKSIDFIQVDNLASRVIFSTWIFACVFVMNVFVCIQISDMPATFDTIDSLHDVVTHPNLVPFMMEKYHTFKAIEKTASGKTIIERAKEKGTIFPLIQDYMPIAKKFASLQMAYLMFTAPFSYSFPIEGLFPEFKFKSDTIYFGKESFSSIMLTTGYGPRLSGECQNIMNYWIYRTFETQSFDISHKKEQWKWEVVSLTKSFEGDTQLNFDEFSSFLMLWLRGTIMSLIIFVIEYITKFVSSLVRPRRRSRVSRLFKCSRTMYDLNFGVSMSNRYC